MLALVLPSNRLVVYGAFRSTVFRSTERLAGSFNSKTFSLGCRLMSCMPPHLFTCGVGCVMTWLPDDLFMAITCTSRCSCVWHAQRYQLRVACTSRCTTLCLLSKVLGGYSRVTAQWVWCNACACLPKPLVNLSSRALDSRFLLQQALHSHLLLQQAFDTASSKMPRTANVQRVSLQGMCLQGVCLQRVCI